MIAALLLAAAASSSHPPLLVFHGNIALVEDVYRSVLAMPDDARATAATARSVAVKLRKFLHRAGYTLATVDAFVSGEQIEVKVDEGRLEKIIFLGGGAFETLRLRLDLHIHDDVFNRPELERQLASLSQRLGLADFAYEVVPVGDVPVPKLQLDDIEPLEEMSLGLLRPGRPYELRILVTPGAFHPGLEPELEIDSIEGGGLGLTWHGGSLLAADDRFELGGRLAGAVREKLDGTETVPTFTRALGRASYSMVPIAGVLRPSLHASVDLQDLQRADLRFDSYRFAVLEGGATALFVPIPEIKAAVGIGVARRLLFDVTPQDNVPLPQAPFSLAQTREYGEVSLELTLDPENLRRDQHHSIYFGARVFGPAHPGETGEVFLEARYQKFFTFGWDDLVITGRGISRSGSVIFAEEESLGDNLRGPFSNIYARKILMAGLEWRWSLLRDVFKVGIFHNGAIFGRVDRTTDLESPALANGFGLGLHALILDAFQLDAYFGEGFASGGFSDHGAALAIRQAY